MPNYNELKNEMVAISDILKLYPESLQTNVFTVLIKQYLGGEFTNSNQTDFVEVNEVEQGKQSTNYQKYETQKATKKEKPQAKRKNGSSEIISIAKDLDLSGRNASISLKDFVLEKSPKSNIEVNVVCAYYLRHTLNFSQITVEHIYTCYKELKRPIGSIRSSIKDTSTKYGFFNYLNNEISITIRGDNLVEHELPRLKSK